MSAGQVLADMSSGKKLTKPIKFVVRNIILEPDTRWASIETKGCATRMDGMWYPRSLGASERASCYSGILVREKR